MGDRQKDSRQNEGRGIVAHMMERLPLLLVPSLFAVLLAGCPPDRTPGDDDGADDDDVAGAGDEVRLTGAPGMSESVPAIVGVARYEDFGMSAGLAGGRDADCASWADYLEAALQAKEAFEADEITQDQYMASVVEAAAGFYGLGGPMVSVALGSGAFDDAVELDPGPWPTPTDLGIGLLADTVPDDPQDLLEEWLAWDEALGFSGEIEAWGAGRLQGWFEVTGFWVGGSQDGVEVTIHAEVDVPVCDP